MPAAGPLAASAADHRVPSARLSFSISAVRTHEAIRPSRPHQVVAAGTHAEESVPALHSGPREVTNSQPVAVRHNSTGLKWIAQGL
jgi:hypothetical protein